MFVLPPMKPPAAEADQSSASSIASDVDDSSEEEVEEVETIRDVLDEAIGCGDLKMVAKAVELVEASEHAPRFRAATSALRVYHKTLSIQKQQNQGLDQEVKDRLLALIGASDVEAMDAALDETREFKEAPERRSLEARRRMLRQQIEDLQFRMEDILEVAGVHDTPESDVLDVLDEAQQLGNPLELAPLLRKLQDFLELLHHTARQELQEALKDEAGTDVMELALFRYEGFEADDIQFLHRKVADKRDAAV